MRPQERATGGTIADSVEGSYVGNGSKVAG